MKTSQRNSPVEVLSTLGESGLLLSSLSWREGLGRPFEAELELLSENSAIDLAAQLRKPISVRIDRTTSGSYWLNGFVSRFESLGPAMRLARYRATLVPAIGLLKQSGGCRIFQDFTTLDIVKKIFYEHGFGGDLELRLSQTYRKRPYCVQYAESDLQFVSRLMEEDGIYYFFEYAKNKHTMILADDLSAHRRADGCASVGYRDSLENSIEEYLTDYTAAREFRTGAVVLNDYDFEKPKSPLLVKQKSPQRDASFEWYDFPGRYSESDDGQRLARVRIEAVDAAHAWVQMQGNCRGLRCGSLFGLKGHSSEAANIEYLTTSATYLVHASGLQSGGASEFRCDLALTAQPTKIPFRSSSQTTRPVMRGPHLATVCGKPGEEIWTDPYGRIKVQFPWDRDGKGDEHSSCWIRVAQAWTGKNWGAMSLPRIGDEVIVEFLDGNPDRPIVTGRVYNAERMPPEALAAAQAKTVFRTRSTKGGDATAFHELSFDDSKDRESIYFHSERDFNRVVENNDSLWVGFEKHSPGDQAIEIYHDQKIQVGQGSGDGSLTLTVQQDRSVTVKKGHDSLVVQKGNQTIQIDSGNLSAKVASGTATIEAAKSILLKCGSSMIELTPSEIQISSPSITVKADGALQMNSATTSVKADGSLELQGTMGSFKASAIMAVKGALVQIN